MVAINLILLKTIAIIVVVIHGEIANAEDMTPSKAFKVFYNHICILYYGLKICTEFVEEVFEIDKDGRYALRNAYFKWKFVKNYHKYILETVMGLIESGDISVQSPSQYCSIERERGISQEELTRLSALGLSVVSSTKNHLHDTPGHLGMISQIDSGMSSLKDFDLNLTTEEYNEKVKKNKKNKTI